MNRLLLRVSSPNSNFHRRVGNFKRATEKDDRVGNKYDVQLNLSSVMERTPPGDLEGFRAREFRSGGESSDPDDARAILSFFRNRTRPPRAEEADQNLHELLLTPKREPRRYREEEKSALLIGNKKLTNEPLRKSVRDQNLFKDPDMPEPVPEVNRKRSITPPTVAGTRKGKRGPPKPPRY